MASTPTMEWGGGLGYTSAIDSQVFDNNGMATTVLDAAFSFNAKVTVNIPAPLRPILDGKLRVRLFAESMGPGPEKKLGEILVSTAPASASYDADFSVAAGALPAEGDPSGVPGEESSGVYRLVVAVQYINTAGVHMPYGGYHDGTTIHLRKP